MTRMHADEIEIEEELARALIATQFPRFAGLPVTRVRSAGTDHTIYRLGDDKAARFPRIGAAAQQAASDFRWLRPLAPHLSLDLPVPAAVGEPWGDYPFQWSICKWIEGENAFQQPPRDLGQAASDLAIFILSLRHAPPADDPPAGNRGGPLIERDSQTRSAIAQLGSLIDTESVTRAWEESLAAPQWKASPVWLHGDIHAGNLIVSDGVITGVIDFGCLTVGDPATDLMVAWSMLDTPARQHFRRLLGDDDATWLRGRGWALSWALIVLPYYLETNPMLVSIARRVIGEVLDEHISG